jgi:hypothetical protein
MPPASISRLNPQVPRRKTEQNKNPERPDDAVPALRNHLHTQRGSQISLIPEFCKRLGKADIPRDMGRPKRMMVNSGKYKEM